MGSKSKIGKTKVSKGRLIYPANPQGIKVHLIGDALIAYIKDFDSINGLKSGSTYIIQGKEITI